MLKRVLLSFCGQNPVNLAPIGSCICTCALICFQCSSPRHFISSSHSLNYDRSFTAKRRSLRHSNETMALCNFFKPNFYRFHVILLAQNKCHNHKSDPTEEQINFGGLKLCSAIEIKHFLMFIHVHFMLWVNMKRLSVQMFELRQYSDLSRHIEEPQNNIYCLNIFENDTI